MNTKNLSVPLPGEMAFTGVPGELGEMEVAYLSHLRRGVIGVQLVNLNHKEYVVSLICSNGGHLIVSREADSDKAVHAFREVIMQDMGLLKALPGEDA